MRARGAVWALAISLAPAIARGAEITPRGWLDKKVIRRVVRSHLAEVIACVERASPPSVKPFSIWFAIERTGRVSVAEVQRSQPENAAIANCVAESARGWVFPAPEGGRVVVTYPFTCFRFAASPRTVARLRSSATAARTTYRAAPASCAPSFSLRAINRRSAPAMNK